MGNNLDIDLEGKYVILYKKDFPRAGERPIDRMFLCSGGFGCSPDTSGRAIFGHFTVDGEDVRVEGYQVERLATPEEIAQAKYPNPPTEKQKAEIDLRKLHDKKRHIEQLIKEAEDRFYKLDEIGH